ncbi:hypothetical protein [Rugosimonospora africana]|uniref:DUF4352 domain-containing protein n=1 Tax=Rugosimonospora africana TaxID=556532 RepID=A0A8J3QVC2_9ACTN|nr:hypothetical protein [Rugosimonospora africana]GIH16490.1 hypothetical protein Raf01_46620 [Rugosimonospora africana]
MAGRPAANRGYARRYAALLTGFVACLNAFALCGCSSGASGSDSAGVTGPVATDQPSMVPGLAPQGHALGESAQSSSGFVSVTVFSYEQPTAGAVPPDRSGDEWAAADVQTCAETGSVFQATVSNAPWSLSYPDGTALIPTRATAAQFPQPAYPISPRSLAPGQCLRGWVVFAVPAGRRPQVIRYAPQGATPIDWLIQ